MNYKNILVTGGCGFIGSHFIRYLLKKYPTVTVINVDVLAVLKKPKTLKMVVPDRPGHDSRYLLDSGKLKKLGWRPQVKWSDGLTETVAWYKNNKEWWKPLLTKSHSWK